jgi:hypothetical protein
VTVVAVGAMNVPFSKGRICAGFFNQKPRQLGVLAIFMSAMPHRFWDFCVTQVRNGVLTPLNRCITGVKVGYCA